MRAASVLRVEKGFDRMAAAAFAAACAYAAYAWFGAEAGDPMAVAETAAAGLMAYVVAARGLSAVQPKPPRLPVPIFDVRQVEPYDDGAHSIPEAIEPAEAEPDDALLLDDILAALEPDSRVVRLFDPAAMPTAGELQSRIDRHLEGSAERNADASQALHDALAELRRSIR
jgi:hypothetical protein